MFSAGVDFGLELLPSCAVSKADVVTEIESRSKDGIKKDCGADICHISRSTVRNKVIDVRKFKFKFGQHNLIMKTTTWHYPRAGVLDTPDKLSITITNRDGSAVDVSFAKKAYAHAVNNVLGLEGKVCPF